MKRSSGDSSPGGSEKEESWSQVITEITKSIPGRFPPASFFARALAAGPVETSSILPAKIEPSCGDTQQAGNSACTLFFNYGGKADSHVIDPAPGEHFVRELTRCQNSVFAYILSLVGNPDAARDIQQETNVVLWRKAGEFKEGSNFMPWALGIARMQVLPESFDDLIPAYMEDVPLDPTIEAPFKIENVEGGVRLYSAEIESWNPEEYPGNVIKETDGKVEMFLKARQ